MQRLCDESIQKPPNACTHPQKRLLEAADIVLRNRNQTDPVKGHRAGFRPSMM